jgi:predicted nucleic acid-binding protein
VKPVLVDTSVWRRFFGGGSSVRRLGELLDEEDLVLTHPWIIGELVLGGMSRNEELLLERLPSAIPVPHQEVLEVIRRRGLTRRGIGWVDVNVLASALASSATLWTLDSDLEQAARELAVVFDQSRTSS